MLWATSEIKYTNAAAAFCTRTRHHQLSIFMAVYLGNLRCKSEERAPASTTNNTMFSSSGGAVAVERTKLKINFVQRNKKRQRKKKRERLH